MKQVVLLSGPIATGKSTVAKALVARYGFHHFKTRELIAELKTVKAERRALQRAGDALDRQTNGQWIADAAGRKLQQLPEYCDVVIDSVRIEAQVVALRRAFGPRVVHIHLTAPDAELERRYLGRRRSVEELAQYADVRKNRTERSVAKLADIADILVDTERSSEADTIVRVASRLGLYGKAVDRLVDVLVGGQYGSEGKGHVASYLAPEYDYLVRSGGPNAGHKVFEEPEPYTHHLLPCGTRCSEAGLIIAPGATLSLPMLLKEIADCEVSSERLSVDPHAMVIEPSDIEFETQSLRDSIGSTAQGVGAATGRKILRTAAHPKVRLAKDAPELQPFVRDTLEILDRAFAAGKKVFVEGTQGTGLSLHHGFYPHVTSRETSVSGCLAEVGIAPTRVRRTLVVIRSYPIRVESPQDGTSGPMGKELEWSDIALRSGVALEELVEKEKTSTTKRKRRVAEFDWSLLRKAASLNGPTDIALTFADYFSVQNRLARRFEQLTSDTVRFIEEVERVAGAPVSLITTRFDYRSIIDRRAW